MEDTSYLNHTLTAKHWQRIGIKHHHGVAVPLFSIRSDHSHGIGEYTDLPLLIDWCSSIGFDVIQLLPLNDTGNGTSPYSSLSAFALNPIFIGLDALPQVNEHPFLRDQLKALPKFSNNSRVDYSKVREYKDWFLSQYFHIMGPQIQENEDFKQFMESAASWLRGYAAFKILKERHHGQSWEVWIEKESSSSLDLIDSIAKEEQSKFNLICFLQYICDQQLRNAKAYAEQKNVFLMGDIPILIDRDSADVWLNRELFDLSYSAGAPPDFYCEMGQNWGFPTYNWDIAAQQDYRWWSARLKWASRYYQLYRIDHIVGFFRIWSIRLGLTAKDGEFNPQDEQTWVKHGRRILEMMIDRCDMLPIGEDLGVVPPEARNCLSELGICGTRVVRWERHWDLGGSFIPMENYPEASMTTISTHDSEPLQQWWMQTPAEAEAYANHKGWTYTPQLSSSQIKEILWESHHTSSLFHINLLQEYFGLVPGLSWPTPSDERINIPGIMIDSNWCYRLRPSLEELMQNIELQQQMKSLID